ncbi:transketolase [Sulfurimonas lithotrophica]|uniref:Transketolase n=1 Tax=Sulfurimonas lithotrophica TaxID=2590022 RepID=A0A5P8NY51_9BACT|nr:1-deoxy-D-xylulose-5-phosphate synthase N-terminal domain-containing protein [Sulfurimonas lithotrophica]QFR48358.1 transketolase [Sulfurimonas lithotrophica]
MFKLNSQDIRKKTIALSCNSGAGHLAPSLSCVEILTTLFRDFLNYNQADSKDESRDRLIFSKGHGAYAYYVILNELGFLPKDELDNFYNGASIKGCLTQNLDYMIEASTGSLGHGLPISVGIAQALKMQNKKQKVVCIVGDGEMQEGSNFEALNLAYRFKLDNLLLIVDANNLQAMDKVSDVGLDNDRLSKVLSVYTDNFSRINGHDEVELKKEMGKFFNEKNNSLSIMLCDTLKGKGVDVCENSIAHHFRCPTQDGYVLGCDDE